MKSLKESRVGTLILEKEEKPSENFIVEETKEEKKESAKKVLFENNSTETYMENLKKNFSKPEKKVEQKPISQKIQFEAVETFFSKPIEKTESKQTNNVSIQKENIENTEKEIKIEEPVVQTQIEENQELESKEITEISEEENLNEEQAKNNKRIKRAKFKTRLGIMIFGLVSVVACMIGWTIANAVEIKTLTQELEQANKIYSVDVVKHISNISKADDLTNPDSIFDLSALSDAKVIPLTPEKLEKPVEYSVKSNWFDRLCNWISNLFN